MTGTVELHCLCNETHVFPRQKAVDGLGKTRWKCASCKRRFVVACTPGTDTDPEKFWPIFLEDIPVRGDTQEMGIATQGRGSGEVPPELQFECRCGCRLVGEKRIYGKRTRCPKCDARIVVRVGYQHETGKAVALLDFPDDTGVNRR